MTAAAPEFLVLGQAIPRLEGPDKVRGRTRYAGDAQLPGMLWGKNVRSPHPHARIVAIDPAAALRVPGVRAVITAADVSDRLTGRAVRDHPIICRDRVRFAGDRVAAVAAESLEAAEEAALLVQVAYEELPAVLDPIGAMAPEAPIIHPDPYGYAGFPREIPPEWRNVCAYRTWERGDVDAAFARADLVLEHTFHTQLSHQGYLEPHACLVSAGDPAARIEVWASAKTPFAMRRELALIAGRPEAEVLIHPTNTGADFGSKAAPEDVPIAYFLSRQTGRPVKMIMTSAEDLTATHPRSPSVITLRSAVQRDGRILAREARVVYDSGAYAAFRPGAGGGMLGGAADAAGAYHIPALRIDARMVYTNQVPCGYMRAPGQPQMAFAVENHMDRIARALDLDPLELRLRNLPAGDHAGQGDHAGHHAVIRGLLRSAADEIGWSGPRAPFVGRGIAAAEREIGQGEGSGDVTLNPDGTLTVVTATPDNGTGAITVAAAFAAECLGVPIERVRLVHGGTDDLPYDAEGGGSRLTNVIGTNVIAACDQLKAQLTPYAARMLGSDQVEWVRGGLRGADGRFVSLEEFAAEMIGPADPAAHAQVSLKVGRPPGDCYGVEAAEVAVDPETGEVELRRLVAVHTVGTIVNAIGHQGQIDGAIVQGIGYALTEQLTREEGRITNGHLGDYKLPSIGDIPDLISRTVPIRGGGPMDAAAIGETPIVTTAAAIANAVADAIGAPLDELPITAEAALRLLNARRQMGGSEPFQPPG
jgi:CO/xanthine dehydrogenase Mo-binding subunit